MTAKIIGAPVTNAASQACVDLLETVLADAKTGHITSVAIVACGPGGFSPAIAGPQAPELNLGLDACKQIILERVMPERQPSAIMMPGRRR